MVIRGVVVCVVVAMVLCCVVLWCLVVFYFLSNFSSSCVWNNSFLCDIALNIVWLMHTSIWVGEIGITIKATVSSIIDMFCSWLFCCQFLSLLPFFPSVPAFGWLGVGRWLVIRCWFLLVFDDRWWLLVVVVVAVVALVVGCLFFVLGCHCCWRRRFLFAFHIAARSVKTRRVSQASRPAAGLFVRADLGMTDLGSHNPRSFKSVDGRNPAPPGMYKNPVNDGINYILISWCRISLINSSITNPSLKLRKGG